MYTTYLDSFIGTIQICCNDRFLESITLVKEKSAENSNEICELVVKQLDEYFNGNRKNFDVPINYSDSFYDRVYKELYEVPFGTVVSYKELGQKLNSKAHRAVGTAMAKNPYLIVVP